jgi:O-antigen/teichoic acid export membrane protein
MTERASYSSGAAYSALSFGVVAVLSIGSSIAIARLYGVAVVGEFALVMAPVNAVWLVSSARERPAFVRAIAVLEPRAPRCTGLFAAVLTFSIVLTVVVATLALPVVYAVFNGPVNQPNLFVPAAVSLAVYTVIVNTCVNLDAVFTAFRAGRELFWIRLVQIVAFIALAVPLSSPIGGVWALIAATAGSSAISLGQRVVAVRAFMALTVRRNELSEGFRTLPEIIRFGLKMTPGGIADGVCTEIGTWALGTTASVAVLGAYSRAWLIANRLLDINYRATEMLLPTLVARHDRGDRTGFDRAFVDTLRYCAAALLLPAAAAGGAAASIMALYGPGFARAAPALALLLLVPAAVCMANIQRRAFLAVDRPGTTSVLGAARLAITATATVALTVRLGMTGTALGLLAGAAAEVASIALLAGRYLETPLRTLWRPREQVATLLAYGAGFGAARGTAELVPGVAGLVPALAAGAIAFVAVLVATGGLNDRDRARIGFVAHRVRGRLGIGSPSAPHRA